LHHRQNPPSAQNLLGDFEFASDEEISALDLKKGFIGVKDLSIDLIVDYIVLAQPLRTVPHLQYWLSSSLILVFHWHCYY
jgi:hypothetical protein